MEQYMNYSNYRSLINDRNDRYEGGEARILLSQRGEEKALGELGCTRHSERSTKCEVGSSKPPERLRESVASIYSAKETHTVALYAGS